MTNYEESQFKRNYDGIVYLKSTCTIYIRVDSTWGKSFNF